MPAVFILQKFVRGVKDRGLKLSPQMEEGEFWFISIYINIESPYRVSKPR